MKVGILGGGQLARMLTLAAQPLGISTYCLDPNPNVSASYVTNIFIADYQDEDKLKQWLQQCDVITYENENIPVATAKLIHQFKPLYPSIKALEISQDRLYEKNLFRSLKINTPHFMPVNSFKELKEACAVIQLPAILKTRRFGYDGKGQYLIKQNSDVELAWEALGNQSILILEQFIHFERELSLVAARNLEGATCFYPLTENQHKKGILRVSTAPYQDVQLQQQAEEYAQKIFEQLDYVGVLAIEFFQLGKQLLANEMAPRVHNSGHWTIEGAQTSQFENHIRAICGLPLGATQARRYNIMFNCIGEEPEFKQLLAIPGAHYHSYNKQARPGRKLSHITLSSDELDFYQAGVEQLKNLLK